MSSSVIVHISTLANEFPLYFRAPLLICLFWFLWGINLVVFNHFDIDYGDLLNLNYSLSPSSNTNPARSNSPSIASNDSAKSGALNGNSNSNSSSNNNQQLTSPKKIILSSLTFMGFILLLFACYRARWPFHDDLIYPALLFTLCAFILFSPFDIFLKHSREWFMKSLYRVIVPPVTGVLFVEVVFGDVLTSLCKVIADLEVTMCVLITHASTPNRDETAQFSSVVLGMSSNTQANGLGGSNEEEIIQSSHVTRLYGNEYGCADTWMRPFVTSLPFIFRFCQCFRMYRITGLAFPHLANCAKYLSSLPVIWISSFAYRYPDHYTKEMRLAWIFAVSFNSFFAFMWDIVMDWGFCRQGANHFLLRGSLLYMVQPISTKASGNGSLAAVTELVNLVSMKKTDADDIVIDKINGTTTPEKRLSWSDPSNHKMNDTGNNDTFGSSSNSNDNDDGGNDENEGLISAQFRRKLPSRDAISQQQFNETLSMDSNNSTRSPSSLRCLIESSPFLYYFSIILDFVLRILWSFKLSVHFQLTQEGVTFALEIFEIFRRFVWIFFRVEWEAIERKGRVL